MSVRHKHLVGEIAGVSSLLALTALVAPSAQAVDRELEAHMQPTSAQPRAHGEAEFDQEGGFREFEISVHHIRGLAGHRVAVRVHGALVGRMLVRSDGFAHLDRHRGVPDMHAGNIVRVRTSGGALVSRGRLHLDTG